jgi:hypothetical protein
MTPKKSKSGARRRVTQNKTPAHASKGVDTQNSALGTTGSDSLTWSIAAGAIPRFGSVDKFDNRVHNVIQTVEIGNIGSSTTSLGLFYALSLNATTHITQFSSWASVFDQYRIMEVEIWAIPIVQGTSSTVTAMNLSSFNVYTAIDYDNDTTPVGTAGLLQYSNVIVAPWTQGHYRKWRPHVASAIYGGGAFTSYANIESPWIDCTSANASHYGFKLATDTAPANSTLSVQLSARLWVQFRNTI